MPIAKKFIKQISSTSSVDWTSITGKPSFATVATSGSYSDLLNKPTLPSTYISASSLGTNGYIKFSNGLKIVWGKTADITASSYRNKSYEVKFNSNSSASFTTIYTVIASCGGNITNGDVKVKSMSTSGFTAFIDNLVAEGSGGSLMTGTGYITYIAVGYSS